MLQLRDRVKLKKGTLRTMEGSFSIDDFGYVSHIDHSSPLAFYVVPKNFYLCSLVNDCSVCDIVCGNVWREEELEKIS